MVERSSHSAFSRAQSSDTTATPICWLPVSMPSDVFCTAHPVLYSSRIVNGFFRTISALCALIRRRALRGDVGIRPRPFFPMTNTDLSACMWVPPFAETKIRWLIGSAGPDSGRNGTVLPVSPRPCFCPSRLLAVAPRRFAMLEDQARSGFPVPSSVAWTRRC